MPESDSTIPQPGRIEVPLDEWVEALRGATIDDVDVEQMGEYIVIKVGVLTLYADAPILYGPDPEISAENRNLSTEWGR